MSSTNRGYNRHATDYYVTPREAVDSFFKEWGKEVDLNKVRWLDPCAGGDSRHPMTYPMVIKEEFDPEIIETIDVREDSLAETKIDYRLWEPNPAIPPQVIITNPPFYLAEQIIDKALRDVCDGGYVVMLLRLNFFGSNARFPFWQKQLPTWTYVHHRRFSFTDDGKTDSIEYMHAVWKKGASPAFSMLKVI